MKVVVIGLGSMGNRRIRLLKKHCDNVKIVGVDANLKRRKKCEETWAISTDNDLSEVLKEHQLHCAFICTPPVTHSALTTQCLEAGLHVFSELNLVADGYLENMSLAKDKNLILFLSSTLLYREEIEFISKTVHNTSKLLNYSYHVGQYLPDWHPWEAYHDFFVSNKRTNGCRELFAIELPWLIHTFGEIKEIQVISNKISSLDLDYNDNYLVLCQHKTGHKGMVAIDIVSRKAVRNFEAFGEDLHLTWDGTPEGLYIFDIEKKEMKVERLYQRTDKLNNYSETIIEDAYLREIVDFFDMIEKRTAAKYSFEKDLGTLKIIDNIEGFANEEVL